MIMTKINFTSDVVEFTDFDVFEDYMRVLVNGRRFDTELHDFIVENLSTNKIFPVEKLYFSGKSGYIQHYHKDSLDAKSYQLALINTQFFKDLFNELKTRHINIKIEMLSSDEYNLNSESLRHIHIEDDFIV